MPMQRYTNAIIMLVHVQDVIDHLVHPRRINFLVRDLIVLVPYNLYAMSLLLVRRIKATRYRGFSNI
jgi:hypothetical protein